jgi:dTDP-4-dehydrorhamnose reductase
VFDGRKPSAYTENDVPCPVNGYGRQSWPVRRPSGTASCHVILRTAWLYGEFGHNFLKTIVRLSTTRDELRVVSDQHGNPTSTRQLADAILRIVPCVLSEERLLGHLSFCRRWHHDLAWIATHIVAAQAPLTGRHPVVTAITSGEYGTISRPANSALDCTRSVRAFGFQAILWSEEAGH